MSPARPEPIMPIEVMIGPPTSSTRRPNRSATMPAGTFTIRRASANTVRVSPTIVALTPNSFAYKREHGGHDTLARHHEEHGGAQDDQLFARSEAAQDAARSPSHVSRLLTPSAVSSARASYIGPARWLAQLLERQHQLRARSRCRRPRTPWCTSTQPAEDLELCHGRSLGGRRPRSCPWAYARRSLRPVTIQHRRGGEDSPRPSASMRRSKSADAVW